MGASRLVGRDAEIALLYKALADAAEHGGALLVTGAAGIAKTSVLDRATASVLSFVARRLESTHILLVIGMRETLETALRSPQLQEIHVEPLSDTASADLLVSVAPDLDVQTRRLILDEALGNPLALLELPRALRLQGTDGREGALRSIPLTDRLERTFSAHPTQLTRLTQPAPLLAASCHDP